MQAHDYNDSNHLGSLQPVVHIQVLLSHLQVLLHVTSLALSSSGGSSTTHERNPSWSTLAESK
jgi:hypothetical protein